MKFERNAGILLHPTSLPGKYGIGDLGYDAYKFVDFLEKSGQKLWQVFPRRQVEVSPQPRLQKIRLPRLSQARPLW